MDQRQYEVRASYTKPNVFVYNSQTGLERPVSEAEVLSITNSITDSLVNTTNRYRQVDYGFWPYIYDTRPGHENDRCGPGEAQYIPLYINPTPRISVDIEDSILCDGGRTNITVDDEVITFPGTDVVYGFNVNFNSGLVSGTVPNFPEEHEPDYILEHWMFNNSDTVQILDYNFVGRIKDNRAGQPVDKYCDNGNRIPRRILLNPRPRFRYTLAEDSLCFDDGFTIFTDSLVYATHPLYYNLDVENNNSLNNVISPVAQDSFAVVQPLIQEDVLNPGTGWGRIKYTLHPYISTENCPGTDTTFVIDVNPEPRMQSDLLTPKDTAVCYDQGYMILMNTVVDSTTGQLLYNLTTSGYIDANVDNERTTGPYLIEDLDQMSVVNLGDSIEDINYQFLPFIQDAKGAGKHCYGDPRPDIIVQVAPELKGQLVANVYIGGNEIRCYGLLSLLYIRMLRRLL